MEWTTYITTNPRLMYTDTPDGNRIWRSESGALTVEVLSKVELVDNSDVLPLDLERQTITDLTPPPETEKPKRKKKARKKP
jgi:hypothetical protein